MNNYHGLPILNLMVCNRLIHGKVVKLANSQLIGDIRCSARSKVWFILGNLVDKGKKHHAFI